MENFVEESKAFRVDRIIFKCVLQSVFLVVSLAWSDAFSLATGRIFNDDESVVAKFTQAFVLTLTLCVGIGVLSYFYSKRHAALEHVRRAAAGPPPPPAKLSSRGPTARQRAGLSATQRQGSASRAHVSSLPRS